MAPPSDVDVGDAMRFHRQRHGDRYSHSIYCKIDAQYCAVLESIEPESARDEPAEWPASPPLKDWHDEKRDRATVLMAVGAAGKSHWSASIELCNDGTARFDVAARINAMPAYLGSEYACLLGSGALDETSIELTPGILLNCDPGTTRLRFDKADCRLVVEPLITQTDVWPQTIRWRYWIRGTPALPPP
ncbi:MAG TPA: hypothetical protein VGG64_08405 [Pirellulales bacterium]|jgi:hypothetical protein